MNSVHQNIKKEKIDGKGYGYIATEDIPKGTIIIKEKPAFQINDKNIVSDILQLLYEILKCSDKSKRKRFKSLMPYELPNNNINSNELFNILKMLKITHPHIYSFLTNIKKEKLLLYCAKYACNAFDFDGKPVILFNGTVLNHSCLPNVIFGKVGEFMVFETVRHINKGEELCDSYIDITDSKINRLNKLKSQYGFTCTCCRCKNKNKNDKIFSSDALKIEYIRFQKFGFSKSNCFFITSSF